MGTLMGMRITPARRVAFFAGSDALIVTTGILAGYLLRFGGAIPPAYRPAIAYVVPAAILVYLLVLWQHGIYRLSWGFVGLRDVVRVAQAVLIATALLAVPILLRHGQWPVAEFPRSLLFIQAALVFVGLAGFRLVKRIHRLTSQPRPVPASAPTLILGAGHAGEQVFKSISETSLSAAYRVVGFLDDDRLATGTRIHGVSVLGTTAQLEHVVAEKSIETIILCIANVTSPFVRDILRRSHAVGVTDVRIIPPVNEIVGGSVTFQSAREVTLEDLLGRDPIHIQGTDLAELIGGRRVLVTGGAGTIGSELSRQVAAFRPERLVIVDIDETRLHEIVLEAAARPGAPMVIPALLDVRDEIALDALFAEHHFDVVFHAAAYKHVPMMESHPLAAIDVNVLGTANVSERCQRHRVGRFVLISTDKAVEPSSVMGASKRLGELVLFGEARGGSHARASAVRFGNVIGSRGSVIPLFERQLRAGGPLTVTHPEIERFFMMTSEAVALVLQAAALGEGGDVFVLEMGRPVKIIDVAREFIRLHGLEPDVDIPIVITGLRPGEKLYEVLHYPHEHLTPTAHPRILRTHVLPDGSTTDIVEDCRRLVAERDAAAVTAYLRRLFPSIEMIESTGGGAIPVQGSSARVADPHSSKPTTYSGRRT